MRSNRTEGTIYFLFTGKESKTKKSGMSRQNRCFALVGRFFEKSLAKTAVEFCPVWVVPREKKVKQRKAGCRGKTDVLPWSVAFLKKAWQKLLLSFARFGLFVICNRRMDREVRLRVNQGESEGPGSAEAPPWQGVLFQKMLVAA